MERLARVAGVSPDHLSRLFRETGMSACASAKALRLDAAARLLTDSPELGIKQVAAAVGFQERSHFSRAL